MRRTLRVLLGACVLALCVGAPVLAQAPAEAAAARPDFPVATGPRLRADVQQRLQAAQDDADAGDYTRALARLDAIAREYTRTRALNRYERANLHYFYAFIHEARGQPADAIRAYEQVLAQRGLPETMELGTRYNLARLYVDAGEWQRADAMLGVWLRKTDAPPPEARVLRAQALYRLERHAEARREIQAALDGARRRHQPPQEAWYVLLRAVAYESGDLKATADTLLALARGWPRKTYLLQLSGIYGELGDPLRQVSAMEAALHAGWLGSESEQLALAYLYLDAGLPVRAARLLEEAVAARRVADSAANLELLGLAWRRAHDVQRAMPWLESAAQLANDAAMWARLAGIELEEARHGEAADAARRALALGGGPDRDATRVLLGTALYRLGRLQEAREAFAGVPRESTASGDARRWLRFLDGEIAREAELAREV
jgi:hypothetical protein